MLCGFALLQSGAGLSAAQDMKLSPVVLPTQGELLLAFCLTLGLVYPTLWWWCSGNRDLLLSVGALME